jgi:ribosomal protein L37AE/L43A
MNAESFQDCCGQRAMAYLRSGIWTCGGCGSRTAAE